ncbi:MAG: hypothetical protein J7621_03140 [Niastella sp.]|nr:hypothetical protein [Niastella sp.]
MYRYIALLFVHSSLLFTCFAQETTPLSYDNFIHVRNGLRNSYTAITQRQQLTVAYLGGSITHNPGWRNKVDSFLRQTYPACRFRSIGAGIPSLGSLPHVFRLQQDVLDSGKIDLLFIEAAVNDRVNGTDSITQVRTLDGIVRHALRSNSSMNIIMMSFADPDKTKDYDNNHIPAEIVNHEMVAAHYGLPSINLAREVHDRMQHGEFSWEKDFKDLHPSPFGQQLYFASIRELLQRCFAQAAQASAVKRKTALPNPLDLYAIEKGRYYPIKDARTDNNWQSTPNWTPTDGLTTRPGFVNRPMLVATTPGATLTLSFKGTAIGMAIVSGSDAGHVSYSIDNGPFKEIDLFTQWSRSLHLPWYILFSSELTEGKHQLQLRIADKKNEKSNGHACRIVHFLTNDSRK